MIKQVPIPTAGVMLGLVALGNLLAPYSLALQYACGVSSAFLGILLLFKIIFHPSLIKNDMNGNSVFASVSATFFMSIMHLCTYTVSFFPILSEVVWFAAIAGHVLLMIWFTYRYMIHFELRDVYPTYFIAYVGIVVASVTSPAFQQQAVGEYIFWFGFVAYAAIFALVTVRYVSSHAISESSKPLFCIYTAPMSLSLAGYLACVEEKSLLMILIMEICAQGLFLIVLAKMPKLLSLPFYPSYAAFTFPFVITAIAFRQTLRYLQEINGVVPEVLEYIVIAESLIATAIVLYVFTRYMIFFAKQAAAERAIVKSVFKG